jgi:vitamin B12 transporter
MAFLCQLLLTPNTSFGQQVTGGLLDTVVVSATRFSDTLRDLPISPVVIDEETIARHPNTDLGDLLEEAGVLVDRQYYLGGQVVIRGLTANISGSDVQSEVLMLLNGHRIGLGSMLRFPSKNIERIEIIRGPMGLQFGSAAMGGVVNVITKRGTGPIQGYAEAGIGSWGHYDFGAGFSGEYKGFDYSVGASKLAQKSDYHIGGGPTYLNTQTKAKIEASAQLGYTFNERHRLGIIVNYLDLQDYGFVGTYTAMNNVTMGVANTSGKTSGDGKYVDLSYEGGTENGLFTWLLKYFVGRNNQEGRTVNAPYHNDINGAQANITGNFTDIGLEVTAGYDLTKYDFQQPSSSGYEYTDMGGYILGKKYFLDDRLVITGGIRVNHVETSTEAYGGNEFRETKWTPAIGFSFMATDYLKFRGNYSQGYRAPTVSELYGRGNAMVGRYFFYLTTMGNRVVNTVYQYPNPNLKPQTSESFELGVDVDLETFRGSLTAFTSTFKGKIDRVDSPFPPFVYSEAIQKWPWIEGRIMPQMYAGFPAGFPNPDAISVYAAEAITMNVGDARIAGLEWSLRWDMGRTFDWGFSLTAYSFGTYLPVAKYTKGPDENTRMRKVPRFFISSGIDLELEEYGLWADLNFIYKSTQRGSNLTSDPTLPDIQPSYVVSNIKIGKTIKEWDSGAIKFQVEVDNIADTYYEVTAGYPLPGRTFYVGLRYDFH